MANTEWKDFELLVAKIQKALSPNAVVTHNEKISGRRSGVLRQIDVSVRDRIGQFDVLIVVDCKDLGEPVDVKAVEEFIMLMQDVGAHQGAIVSAKGFSKSAKTRAADAGLSVYTPIDTDPHKWQVKLELPALCDFRSAKYSIGLRITAPVPFQIPADPHEWIVFDANDRKLGSPTEIANKEWEEGRYPGALGIHKGLKLSPETVKMDNGHGTIIPVELTIDVWVEQQLFYGRVSVDKVSGLRDELTETILTREMRLGPFNLDDVEANWKPIGSEDDLPGVPVLRITARVSYYTPQ